MVQHAFASTHVGRRNNNEDSHLADADLGLYAVADGMGGVEGGEVASALVVETLRQFFERAPRERTIPAADEGRMSMAIRMADREVTRRKLGALREMGSTVAALLVRGAHALVANVGDSRVYLLRGSTLRQVTRDHSMYAEMRDSGVPVNARTWMLYGHVLTRAVGISDLCRPDLFWEKALPGDAFLLCSDGVSDVLDDEQIAFVLGTGGERAADKLVARALDVGARDNLTAIVVRIDDDGALRSSECTVTVEI